MVDLESRAKARRITSERSLGALANDTKWSEFFEQIQSEGLCLELKFIDVDIPSKEASVWVPAKNYIESAQTGPELFVFIEWVRSTRVDEVSRIAKHVGLEYLESDCMVTVYGYK